MEENSAQVDPVQDVLLSFNYSGAGDRSYVSSSLPLTQLTNLNENSTDQTTCAITTPRRAELSFDVEDQYQGARREQDLQIASSLSGQFHSLLAQDDEVVGLNSNEAAVSFPQIPFSQMPSSQNLQIISGTEEHPVSKVPDASSSNSSDLALQALTQPVLQELIAAAVPVPVPVEAENPHIMSQQQESEVVPEDPGVEPQILTVFSCACCAKLAPYPGITEFSANICNKVSISTEYELNFNQQQPQQHQQLDLDQDCNHFMKSVKVSVVDALSLIFEYPVLFSIKPCINGSGSDSNNCANDSIFCNKESHLDFPLCSTCGSSIHQLYLMYKDFTSRLASEGRIIKTINDKVVDCNSNSCTDDIFNHQNNNNNNPTSKITASHSQVIPKIIPKSVSKKSIPPKKKLERKKITKLQKVPGSGVKNKAQKEKLQNQKKHNFAPEKTVPDSRGEFTAEKRGSGPGKAKGRGRPKKAKTKVSKAKSKLARAITSSFPAKKRKSPIKRRQNILEINYDPQSSPPIELDLKLDELGCEEDFSQVMTGDLDFSSEPLPDGRNKPLVQASRQKHPNATKPSKTSTRKLPTRRRDKKAGTAKSACINANNTAESQSIIIRTPTKRIRNWKKESWIEKAQSDPSRTCDLCGKSFIFPAVMRRHKRIVHQGLKPYECSSCGKRFTQKVILNKHTCDFSKEVGNRDILQMTRESELRKFVCTVCGKRFKYPTHLNLHEMNHRDERPYPCSQCDKTFRRPDHLKYHVRIVHVEEKKFICTKCGQTFKSISSLRAHEKKHGSDQGHLCNICGKSIKSMYQMGRHQKTHQDELPFQCPVCGKRFKMKDYLGQHLRRGKSCSKKMPQETIKIENAETETDIVISNPVTIAIRDHQIEFVSQEIGAHNNTQAAAVPVPAPATSSSLNNIIIISTTGATESTVQYEQQQHEALYLQEPSAASQEALSHISSEIELACFSSTTPADSGSGTGSPLSPRHQNPNQSQDPSVSVSLDEQLLTQL